MFYHESRESGESRGFRGRRVILLDFLSVGPLCRGRALGVGQEGGSGGGGRPCQSGRTWIIGLLSLLLPLTSACDQQEAVGEYLDQIDVEAVIPNVEPVDVVRAEVQRIPGPTAVREKPSHSRLNTEAASPAAASADVAKPPSTGAWVRRINHGSGVTGWELLALSEVDGLYDIRLITYELGPHGGPQSHCVPQGGDYGVDFVVILLCEDLATGRLSRSPMHLMWTGRDWLDAEGGTFEVAGPEHRLYFERAPSPPPLPHEGEGEDPEPRVLRRE